MTSQSAQSAQPAQSDNLQNYETSKAKLISGINKVCEVIKPTYGPKGGNVVIESNLYPGHRVVNDGKVITDSIILGDPAEQIGANLLKEACDKQEKECGDGRKTTIILTAAILNEGLKSKKAPLLLKEELDGALPRILKEIDKGKKDIELSRVGEIATIASESKEIGDLIGEIYPKIGREGIIEVESSSVPDTYYDIVEGMRLHGAKMFAGWQTAPDICSVEKPRIIVCKDKIISVSQLEPIYAKLIQERVWEVVLFCEDIEMGVVSRLAQNTVKSIQGEPNRIKTLIIKAPVLFKDLIYEDVRAMTGATPIDSTKGFTFQMFSLKELGSCGSWKATKEESVLNGTKDITEYRFNIKDPIRLGWLNTKVAILKVGANTESELTWKIKKTMDAAHASQLALVDGVVKGAGIAILMSSKNLKSKIMRVALQEPAKLLPGALVYDPALVVKNAISTAISLAGIILTTKDVITIPEEYKRAARQVMSRAQQ